MHNSSVSARIRPNGVTEASASCKNVVKMVSVTTEFKKGVFLIFATTWPQFVAHCVDRVAGENTFGSVHVCVCVSVRLSVGALILFEPFDL